MSKANIFFMTLGLALLCCSAAGMALAAELKTYTNSLGMEFVLIPAGSFAQETEMEVKNERGEITARHTPEMTVSQPFYLGKYEVTQEQWVAVMGAGSNPSFFKALYNPVEKVSWNNAQVFIQKLNQMEGHNRYRLPTEAEWELAARGGTSTLWFFGDDASALGEYAWYKDNSESQTHPVGQKKPNPYGLYDMYGNVSEWVQDYWQRDWPTQPENKDYYGPAEGSSRVRRGGGWNDAAEICRSGYRFRFSRDSDNNSDFGFRLALSPE